MLIAVHYHGRQQAQALGLLGAAHAMAGVLAFLIAGFLGTVLSWRYAFGLLVLLAALITLLSFRLKPVSRERNLQIDWFGALLAAVAILLISLGFNYLNAWGVLMARPATPFNLLGVSPAPIMIVVGTTMMTTASDTARSYARSRGARFREELFELLRIPSLSGDPAHADDVRRAAEWLAGHMRGLELQNVQVMETAGHPVVYGEWPGAGTDKPTVLVYGHYDVVLAALEDGWDSPPFEPVVRDGKIYARGATDDKGQLFIHVKALEAYLKSSGAAPVNVKFLIEGIETAIVYLEELVGLPQ